MDLKNLRNSYGNFSLKEIYSDSTLLLTVLNQGVCILKKKKFRKKNWGVECLKVSLKYKYLKWWLGGLSVTVPLLLKNLF